MCFLLVSGVNRNVLIYYLFCYSICNLILTKIVLPENLKRELILYWYRGMS